MSERDIRVGDAEREVAVSALGDHYAAGRLTKEEYDERSDRAYAARTDADLRPLFADLPPVRNRQRPASAEPSRGWDGRRHHRGWWGVPFLPLLVVVIVLVAVTHVPWPLFLLLGCLWFAGVFRHARHGSPRARR
jgi:hypothetical protein